MWGRITSMYSPWLIPWLPFCTLCVFSKEMTWIVSSMLWYFIHHAIVQCWSSAWCKTIFTVFEFLNYILNHIPETHWRGMVVFWNARVPSCLSASHWLEGIFSPAASLNAMNSEQHGKGVWSARSLLNKRLYDGFIDLAEENAESLRSCWWFFDDMSTSFRFPWVN